MLVQGLFAWCWQESLALDFMPMPLLRNIYAKPFCGFMWSLYKCWEGSVLTPRRFLLQLNITAGKPGYQSAKYQI